MMPDAAHRACRALVNTIDATGGVTHNADGTTSPVADPDWIDLAEAYLAACAALDAPPHYPTNHIGGE